MALCDRYVVRVRCTDSAVVVKVKPERIRLGRGLTRTCGTQNLPAGHPSSAALHKSRIRWRRSLGEDKLLHDIAVAVVNGLLAPDGNMEQVAARRKVAKDPLMDVLEPALKVGAFSGMSPISLVIE